MLLIYGLLTAVITVAYKLLSIALDHPISWPIAGLLAFLTVFIGAVVVIDDDDDW